MSDGMPGAVSGGVSGAAPSYWRPSAAAKVPPPPSGNAPLPGLDPPSRAAPAAAPAAAAPAASASAASVAASAAPARPAAQAAANPAAPHPALPGAAAMPPHAAAREPSREQVFAGAMLSVARDLKGDLPANTPPERRLNAIRIAALATSASNLLTGLPAEPMLP